MLGRVFFGFSVSLLISEALELIPFSLLVILFQTHPFWTAILSFFVNGEKINIVEAFGMVICFTAVICIAINARDQNLELVSASIGDVDRPENYKDLELLIGARLLGICVIILAAICFAATAVFNRALKMVDFNVIMTFHGLFGFFLALLYISAKQLVNILLEEESQQLDQTQILEMEKQDCALLAFGVFIDAFSLFGKTVAF